MLALLSNEPLEKIKFFLEVGADVNAEDCHGANVLIYAKTPEQTNLLLEAGADINVANNFRNYQVKQLLNAIPAYKDPENPMQMIEINMNMRPWFDSTPKIEDHFFSTIREKIFKEILYYIKEGADATIKNDLGMTALMYAPVYATPEERKFLQKATIAAKAALKKQARKEKLFKKKQMKKLILRQMIAEKIDERNREIPSTMTYKRVIDNKFLTKMKIAFMSQLSNS